MTKEKRPGYGIGKMHVVNRDGDRVATLEWKGSLWDGKGKWVDFIDDETEQKIIRAVKLGKVELKGMQVDDMYANGVVVPVWKGFSGMYGGLTQSLPTFGMDVDRDTIEWPGGVNTDYEERFLP